jgi:endonuclease G, mitochondrial
MGTDNFIKFDPSTPSYRNRKGYDKNFLGETIDLPTIGSSKLQEVYTVKEYRDYQKKYPNHVPDIPEVRSPKVTAADPLILNYHHYSVVMNCEYRMCMYTASNSDYTAQMRQDKRKREQYGKDKWMLDPRVPPAFQLTGSEIYDPAHNFDYGHINRREDSCWGAYKMDQDKLMMEYVNADTYHLTNCTPQHELFNQETVYTTKNGKRIEDPKYIGKKGIWGEFENWLQRILQIKGGDKAVLFAGPILKLDKDKKNIRSQDFGAGPVKFPLQFWKVVVVKDKDSLLSYGFVFDQTKSIDDYGLDVHISMQTPERVGAVLPSTSPFETNQRAIKEIEKLTGVVFPDNVKKVDQKKKTK